MFRLKSVLMTAGLLGSLFGFACGPVSAQVAPVEPAAPTALRCFIAACFMPAGC